MGAVPSTERVPAGWWFMGVGLSGSRFRVVLCTSSFCEGGCNNLKKRGTQVILDNASASNPCGKSTFILREQPLHFDLPA